MIRRMTFVILFVFYCNSIFAYDEEFAHPYITQTAINKSNLENSLTQYLGINEGLRKSYDGKSIVQLIQTGSSNEDLSSRARNHFWNPWRGEGLNDLITGLPNPDWAMGYDGNGGPLYQCDSGNHWSDSSCNDYSWRKAREHFYAALTGLTEESRKENYKEMYESLGRIIHLMEDMGVPAHTRNDFSGHLNCVEPGWSNPRSWFGNLYEARIKEKARKDKTYISGLSGNTAIPVFQKPKEYWDTGIYNGSNPEATAGGDTQPGLAEYCSANFLSRSTLFTNSLDQGHKHYHPFPNESSLSSAVLVPHEITAEDGKVDLVTHPAKDKHGERIDHFVATKYVWDRLYIRSWNDMGMYYRLAYYLDDVVHEAYAAKLIPKTVGYAAGLINYFFRGTMSIDDNTLENLGDRYRINLTVRNTTSTGEDMSSGSFQLVIKHPVDETGSSYLLVPEEENVNHAHRGEPTLLKFDVPMEDLPNGLLTGMLDLFVVYKGELAGPSGQVHETEAVCIGHQQIEYSSHKMWLCCFPDSGIRLKDDKDGMVVGVNGPQSGCRTRLSIEKRGLCTDCGIYFGEYRDGVFTELGDIVYNPRIVNLDFGGYSVRSECPMWYQGEEGEFDVVLTNLATGEEIDRGTVTVYGTKTRP